MRYQEFNEADVNDVNSLYKPNYAYKPSGNFDQMSLGALRDEVEHIKTEIPDSVNGNEDVFRRRALARLAVLIDEKVKEQAKKKPGGEEGTMYDQDIQDEDIAAKIAKYIWKNCRPFLDAINFNVMSEALYRGMTTAHNAPFNIHRVRLSGRKPKDTPDHIHNLLNQYFIEKFGEPFRDAVFASGDDGQAEVYLDDYDQKPRAIIPIGNFTFIWSPKIQDLFMDVLDQPATWENGNIEDTIPKLGYQQGDLQAAINSGNEIMIRCERYVSIHYELLYNVQQELLDLL